MTTQFDHQTSDGLTLPAMGFGTYLLNGRAGAQSISSAIQQGYRLLDTAFRYENEGAVGAGIQASGIDRDQLLVTSKLPARFYDHAAALDAIQESLYRASMDYFDLYLLHWPNPKQDKYVEAWQALIDAKQKGLVKHIGVCNFLPEHLDRLLNETGEMPVVNQIELHPYFNQAEQRAYDQTHGIVTEAWSPLGRASAVLNDPVLQQIAEGHQRSVAQVILRWEVQLGVVPLPKATAAPRQKENLTIFDFELTAAEMTQINQLTRPDGRTHQQDPRTYEEF